MGGGITSLVNWVHLHWVRYALLFHVGVVSRKDKAMKHPSQKFLRDSGLAIGVLTLGLGWLGLAWGQAKNDSQAWVNRALLLVRGEPSPASHPMASAARGTALNVLERRNVCGQPWLKVSVHDAKDSDQTVGWVCEKSTSPTPVAGDSSQDQTKGFDNEAQTYANDKHLPIDEVQRMRVGTGQITVQELQQFMEEGQVGSKE